MDLQEHALRSLLLQRGEPLALTREAIAAEPGFVPARLLEAQILAASRDARDFEAAGWAFARLAGLEMSVAERAHVAALAAAIDGDLARASRIYDQITEQAPHDVQALWSAQILDYYLGDTQAQLRRTSRVISHWDASSPNYDAVLALHAYALAECGHYAEAEAAALRALELDAANVRAEHALLHVLEMQGRADEGLLRPARHLSNHLYWHRALFHLKLDRPDQALAVYDGIMRLETLADLIDASALLWRLRLAGANVGGRFAEVAARWAPHAEDAYCAFNDVHAMMAFVAAGRWSWASRLLAAQERRLAQLSGANHDMTRLVGYPASRALAAFGRGEWRTAESLLRSLPPVAHRIGGSHAQRDVLTLTRAAAAQRTRSSHGEFHVSQRLAAA